MIEKVMAYCRKEALLEPGMRVVAGVSGGSDSVGLLRLLCSMRREWGLEVTAVHVNHGIRGQAAAEDMEYVRQLCREWEVRLFCFEEDVPALAAEERLSLEEAGRNVRYRLFEQVRQQTGSDRVAVAHHMDDLAETVLMNLARGSGLRGLAGLQPKRERIIRPLLCLRKREIEGWLEALGISWRLDSTNEEDAYLRNRIRGSLLPRLTEDCNERAIEHITAAAQDLREADEYLCGEAGRLLAAHKADTAAGLKGELYRLLSPPAAELDRKLLNSQPHILSVYMVRQGLKELGAGLKDISRVHMEQILELAKGQSGRQMKLPGGVRVLVSRSRVRLEREQQPAPLAFSAVFGIFSYNNDKKVPQNCCVNWFDYDRITDRLTLRSRQPGDWICVEAGGARKKVKEYLIDAGMPVEVRGRWPLLAMGSRVIWIPGYRMDEGFKVTASTGRVLQAALQWQS